MDSIRILNDGDRFYVVIEKPTEEDKQSAIDFVARLTGIKAKEETPKGVPPAKVEPFTVPENVTEVSSSNKEFSIPRIESPETFTEWYLKMNTFSEENQKKVIAKCKSYMFAYLKGLRRSDMERVKKFMTDFEPAMKDHINNILEKNGYSNLNAFLEVEGDANIQAAYDLCKRKLLNSIGIK